MPAERTRALRCTDSEGSQFVWTLPVSPSTELSTAGNTAHSAWADDLPPLVDAPIHETIIFPPSNGSLSPRRTTHAKKKPEDHIPRPPNAFILFRSSFIKGQHVSAGVETNHSTLSKIIGLTWQNLPEEERQVWHDKAKAALAEHKRKFPQYSFKPLQNRNKGGTSEKRRVREVEPKDLKRCAKIAELLGEGKKGQELDAAIQEFDKHHVPEVVTRFEAPITARAYRRSSSAPVPDTENSRLGQTFLTTTSLPLRASSMRPTRPSTPQPSPVKQQEYHSPVQAEALSSYFEPHHPIAQDISIDFNSFSFDNVVSPVSHVNCDPFSDGYQNSFETPNTYSPIQSVDPPFTNMWSLSESTCADTLSSDLFPVFDPYSCAPALPKLPLSATDQLDVCKPSSNLTYPYDIYLTGSPLEPRAEYPVDEFEAYFRSVVY